MVEEGFHIATGFLQDRVSRRLGMERSHRAGLAYFLSELRLEIGSMTNDGDLQGSAKRLLRPLQEHQTLKRSAVSVHWYTAL